MDNIEEQLDVPTQLGEHAFTRHQLDRLKKAFIFLLSSDEEFRIALRKVFKKHVDIPVREALTKSQLIRRLQEFGPLTFSYKGKMCGFYASEVYAALGEYSRLEVLQMLKDTGLWIRTSSRVHPKTHKKVRTHILDI